MQALWSRWHHLRPIPGSPRPSTSLHGVQVSALARKILCQQAPNGISFPRREKRQRNTSLSAGCWSPWLSGPPHSLLRAIGLHAPILCRRRTCPLPTGGRVSSGAGRGRRTHTLEQNKVAGVEFAVKGQPPVRRKADDRPWRLYLGRRCSSPRPILKWL